MVLILQVNIWLVRNISASWVVPGQFAFNLVKISVTKIMLYKFYRNIFLSKKHLNA